MIQQYEKSKFWGSKTLATALVFALLINQIFYGTTAALAASAPEAAEKLTPKTLTRWTLPKELGRVSYAENSETLAVKSPVVLLIEDAHAVPTAQESIRKIIEHLQTHEGLKTIFFEGAAGRMDPLLFRAFADKKNLQGVFNQYRDRGELSGVTLAAVLNPSESIYEGIEDQPLYEEQINAWLTADHESAAAETKLKTLKASFLEAETRYQSLELHLLNEAGRRFEESHNLENWLKALNETEARAKLQDLEVRYPAIAAVMREMKASENPETAALINKALEDLFVQITPTVKSSASRELFEKRQAYLTEKISAGAWGSELVLFAQRSHAEVEVPALLKDAVRQYRRLEQIRGHEFFDQLERFSAEIRSAMMLTPVDHLLEQMRLRLQLLEKLVRLELTRKEWEVFSAAMASKQPAENNLPQDLTDLQKKILLLDQDLSRETSVFVRFYGLALKREDMFWNKIQPALELGKLEMTAFVGGGFHTDGLRAKLKQAQIAHAVITPAMTMDHAEKDFYREAMRGQVSWGSEFDPQSQTLEPYKAFSRAAVLALSKQAKTHQLKLWQRAVKEAAVQQGQTQYLAEYLQFLSGETEIPESFLHEWQSRVQRFIGDLQRERLQSDRFAPRLQTMTATAPFANPLVRSARYPASWLNETFSAAEASRSEVRVETDLPQKEIDYAALKGLARVKSATVISLQMEMGYSAGFLEAVEAEFGREVAVQVSQASLTGGLGALMHDLFPSWKANGLDIIGIHPIWEEIKKKPYPEGPLHLGQYQRQIMEAGMTRRGEEVITYTIDLNWDEDYQRYAQENNKAKEAFGRQVHVRALKEYTSQYGAPNYHLDAYYLEDETKPDTEENRHRVFDTVYSDDHPAWRDYHMAVYARASEKLIKLLQRQGVVKEKTVEIHNEVFVSMPKNSREFLRQLKKHLKI